MSLLTRLERAADPTNVERHTWKADDQATAVIGHLKKMLATKAGTSKTCPDYGVPDITHLLHDMAEATALMQRGVKLSIQSYEPRLKNVQVRPMKVEVQGQVGMMFEITGHVLLPDGKRQALRFGAAIDDKGQIGIDEL
jgi:type VI secretion system protein